MATETITQIDRPPPGHYQARLSAVLGSQPLGADVRESARTQVRARTWVRCAKGRARRGGQLALPLERR
jgi:hypothetical protein